MPIAVRGFARTLIQGMTGKGFSNRAIMRAVRSRGWGYSNVLLNNDINSFAGRYANEFYIRKLNVNDVIPDYLMVKGELGQPSKYRIHFQSTYYDPTNDTYKTIAESMYTNDYAKVGDWKDANETRTKARYEEIGLEFVNSNVVSVEIQW